MASVGMKIFLLSLALTVPLSVASGAGGAELRPIEWDKTPKAAETEGEVTVYVVDYPRLTVSHFLKAYPKIELNQVDGPSGPALTAVSWRTLFEEMEEHKR